MNKENQIYLASPHMSEEGYEKNYIEEAFESNWIAPLGKNVTEFEKEMEEKTGAKKAVALSSGTAAIHLALKAAEVSEGDIVFCQSLTFAATVNPVVYEKAVPVFIDSERETWNMSPEALEQAFQKYEGMGKKPKAVIVVHLYGLCAKIVEILSICKKYNVVLIEDAAESLGSMHKGKYTGTYGDYGIISFNGNKIITTSGGGMLLINTADAEEKANKVLFWATQAREAAPWYQHKEIGYNYRMSNVLAGIGRGQLKVLDKRVERKRYIHHFYKEELKDLGQLQFMPGELSGAGNQNNCWLTVLELSPNAEIRPMDIVAALQEEHIESRPVWKPMHLQPVFLSQDFITLQEGKQDKNQIRGLDTSIAGELFENGVCIPSDTKLTDEELYRVCNVIKALWKGKRGYE